jgi:hypothetical protein
MDRLQEFIRENVPRSIPVPRLPEAVQERLSNIDEAPLLDAILGAQSGEVPSGARAAELALRSALNPLDALGIDPTAATMKALGQLSREGSIDVPSAALHAGDAASLGLAPSIQALAESQLGGVGFDTAQARVDEAREQSREEHPGSVRYGELVGEGAAALPALLEAGVVPGISRAARTTSARAAEESSRASQQANIRALRAAREAELLEGLENAEGRARTSSAVSRITRADAEKRIKDLGLDELPEGLDDIVPGEASTRGGRRAGRGDEAARREARQLAIFRERAKELQKIRSDALPDESQEILGEFRAKMQREMADLPQVPPDLPPAQAPAARAPAGGITTGTGLAGGLGANVINEMAQGRNPLDPSNLSGLLLAAAGGAAVGKGSGIAARVARKALPAVPAAQAIGGTAIQSVQRSERDSLPEVAIGQAEEISPRKQASDLWDSASSGDTGVGTSPEDLWDQVAQDSE